MVDRHSLSSAWRGFGYLFASQLSGRVLNFLLNLMVARNLDPEDYGVLAVQFHLITTGILFVGREGFRRGCLLSEGGKSEKEKKEELREAIQVSWMCVPYGLMVSWAVSHVVLSWSRGALVGTYGTAVKWLALATSLELLSEPGYILSQNLLLYKLRVGIETLATVLKSFLLYVLLAQGNCPTALVFAYAQVVYSATILLGYTVYFVAQNKRWPDATLWVPTLGFNVLRSEHLRLSVIFSVQAIEKLVLAEGEKLVMVLVENRYNQGVYGLVNNLGSLVVRSVFQPFEEAAFTSFRKQSTRKEPQKTDAADEKPLASLLSIMLRAIVLVGLAFSVFGPPYSRLLLEILYGKRWSMTEAPAVLGLYCYYILLLGANGILEAFMHGVMNASELSKSNLWLVLFSFVHIGTSMSLVTRMGAAGLVVANCLNMAMRITYASWYVSKYFRTMPILTMSLPSWKVLMLSFVSMSGSQLAKRYLFQEDAHVFGSSTLAFVCLGTSMFCLLGFVVYQTEKEGLFRIRRMREKVD